MDEDSQNALLALQRQVEELQELVTMLTACVAYDAAEPYLSQQVKLNMVGPERALTLQVISAVLDRALGATPQRPSSLLEQFPAAEEAFVDQPLTAAEAIETVARCLGVAEEVAERLLGAHRASGLHAEGHAALGR